LINRSIDFVKKKKKEERRKCFRNRQRCRFLVSRRTCSAVDDESEEKGRRQRRAMRTRSFIRSSFLSIDGWKKNSTNQARRSQKKKERRSANPNPNPTTRRKKQQGNEVHTFLIRALRLGCAGSTLRLGYGFAGGKHVVRDTSWPVPSTSILGYVG
jgi:hypothetical protein